MRQLAVKMPVLLLCVVSLAGSSYGGQEAQLVAAGLKLELRLSRETYNLGESIEILVSLENRGQDFHTIYPFFEPETGQNLDTLGYLSEIVFTIRDEEGKKLAYTGDWSCAKAMLPDITQFYLLPPDFFVGRRLSLNIGAFAYDFKKPGTYRVRAVFSTSARTWLAERAKKREI
ncbi:MAG: hypothetical protein HC897_08555 [Thermoanaerobaculia bacterium]|nr:hypothetical protein [Thermoanaerobaculia bacterium]